MAIALDGAAQTGASPAGVMTVALTTTQPGDVIIIAAQGPTSASTGFSVAGVGLSSISQRGVDIVGSGTRLAIFKATAAAIFSGNILVTITTWGGFGAFSAMAFGISGANTATPFDVNGSLPGTTTTVGTAASGTTNNANDFVFAAYSDGVGTAGAGWTQILSNANNLSIEYQIAVAAGSFTGNLNTNVNSVVGVLDAVVAGSAAAVVAAPPHLPAPLLPFAFMRERASGLLEPIRELWKPKRELVLA